MKWYLIIFPLIVSAQLVFAQHLDHQMPSLTGKNIYLAMMDTMMSKMDNSHMGKSVEANFILQMIPHHECAVEMAKYEIQHGKSFTMIQLAKSILAEQTIEVQQMKQWLTQLGKDTIHSITFFQQNIDHAMNTMMQNLPPNNTLKDTDWAFASVMIPHHQAAVDMARIIIQFTRDEQMIAFAKHIISSQQIEIEQMSSFLK